MPGESDLRELLKHMQPQIVPGEFVFCSFTATEFEKIEIETQMMVFREEEGFTVILDRREAELRNFDFQSIWGLITLSVHSDLTAVGLLATITEKLAGAGISVNVISAYYHDHLFVPYEKVNKALNLIEELSQSISQ